MSSIEIQLYNTLTRRKEAFVPIDPRDVRMYACGPTVYDFAHIGNARPIIVFDVLFRLLRHVYGPDCVTYVRNITDLDDKINARAARDFQGVPLNEAIGRLTRETTRQFHLDIAALGVIEPTIEPRATDHIEEMKDMIEALIEKGNAYVAENHVLFSVPSMPDYGKLSNRSLDEMEAGARVDVAPYKRDPMDFVLWKPSKTEEPSWPSPAGIAVEGRPGWHIECSAMAFKHLDEVFDIHAGGIDLVFPHHENELAQSVCAHGTERMANVWMHNGFLQVEGEKMSKSLGNFITIRDLLTRGWDGRVLRFAMLKTHYRQPINWTRKGLTEAALELHRLGKHLSSVEFPGQYSDEFLSALSDDLNTPRAIAELHRLANATYGRQTDGTIIVDDVLSRSYSHLSNALTFLGFEKLDEFDANEMFARIHGRPKVDDAHIAAMIEARDAARKAKNFAESDRIRDALLADGIVLKDGPEGTTWEVAR